MMDGQGPSLPSPPWRGFDLMPGGDGPTWQGPLRGVAVRGRGLAGGLAGGGGGAEFEEPPPYAPRKPSGMIDPCETESQRGSLGESSARADAKARRLLPARRGRDIVTESVVARPRRLATRPELRGGPRGRWRPAPSPAWPPCMGSPWPWPWWPGDDGI